MQKEQELDFLAYILHDKKHRVKALTNLEPRFFEHIQTIFSELRQKSSIFGNDMTADFFLSHLENKNSEFSKEIIQKHTLLYDYKPLGDSDFEFLCTKILDNFKRRNYLSILSVITSKDIMNLTNVEFEKNIDEIKKIISDSEKDYNAEQYIGDIKDVQERWDYYKNIKNNPNAIKTYSTGFKAIDEENGGFSPSELIYVIGRKGTGKSVLLLNIAFHLWSQGTNVILFSLEISKQDYQRRFDSLATLIPSNHIKRGTMSDKEEELFKQYLQDTKEGLYNTGLNKKTKTGEFIIIDMPGKCTPDIVEQNVTEQEEFLNCTFPVVIIDYAGIMQPNIQQKELRHNKAQIALELKQYARKTKKVVISAEQMNRIGKNQKKTENDAIAESDAVADHLDVGMAVRNSNDDDTTGVIESFKTRDMPPFTVYFKKRFDVMKMEEIDNTTIDDWSIGDI